MKKIFAFLLISVALTATAQVPNQISKSYVSDYTGTLTAEQLMDLNKTIYALDTNSTVQIAIVLVNEIPSNTTIEDYALNIGREWGVGNGGNGIVYVAALQQHKQRLEIGTHLEGTITDVDALHITDNIKPYFKANDFYGGLKNMLKEINEEVNPNIQEQKAYTQEAHSKEDNPAGAAALIFLCLGVVGVAVWFFIDNANEKRRRIREEEEAADLNEKRLKERATLLKQQQSAGRTLRSSSAPPVFVPMAPEPKKEEPKRSSSDDDDNNYKPSSYTSRSSSDDNDSFGNFGGNSSFGGAGASNDW